MRQLIWFRQDLRVQDHSALYYAMSQGPCMALVILSPAQWKLHDDAPVKIDFYLRQLEQLRCELHALNIPLCIEIIDFWQDSAQKVLQLCQKHHIQTVHSHIENGWNEQQRDLKTQRLLQMHEIAWQAYTDRSIFPLQSIRNKSGQPYQIFTPFKKHCYEQLNICLPQPFPNPQPQAPWSDAPAGSQPPSLENLYSASISSRLRALWPAGEAYAHLLLEQFAEEQLDAYAQSRDFPALDSTSRLSAYLNTGILSIRQCLAVLFRNQQGYFHIQHAGQQIWLDELLWREFYQHVMADFPAASKHQPFKQHTQNIAWRSDPQGLEAWKSGRTGIPIVDAGMRQMLQSGWMHNRVRMICSMFLSKNLLIDWRLGEAWFMQHLIDGDLAANNGGWQWSASTGTDAAPYFRIFNPVSQSQKFDAQGDYIRRWVPELAGCNAKQIHAPWLDHALHLPNYPKPIADLKITRQRAIQVFKSAQG